eukprot:NODE_57_length_28844_cov_0.352687.p16 type:complete len:251 gc:universal NODE_57_length_28844_cov_0.352687:15994-16746(+)
MARSSISLKSRMEIIKQAIENSTSLEDLEQQEIQINTLMYLGTLSKYDIEKLTQIYQAKALKLQPKNTLNFSQLEKTNSSTLGKQYINSGAKEKRDINYLPYVASSTNDLLKIKSKSLVIENLKDSKIDIPVPVISNEVSENLNAVASVGRVQLFNLDGCEIQLSNPVKSDIFIQNCTNCVISGICHQLRISNSFNLTINVLCGSNPIQEHSENISIHKYLVNEPSQALSVLLKRYKFDEKLSLNLINFT